MPVTSVPSNDDIHFYVREAGRGEDYAGYWDGTYATLIDPDGNNYWWLYAWGTAGIHPNSTVIHRNMTSEIVGAGLPFWKFQGNNVRYGCLFWCDVYNASATIGRPGGGCFDNFLLTHGTGGTANTPPFV